MIACHVCEHGSIEHVALVHVVHHLAILLIDLVNHVADSALFAYACYSYLFNLEHLCNMFCFETVWHFENADMVSHLRLIIISRRLSISRSTFLGFVYSWASGHRVPCLDTTSHVVTAILLLFDPIPQFLSIKSIVDNW